MFSLLFLLFVGVPLVELWLLLQVGERVGAMPTLALVIGTGVLGANLARREGMRTIEKINATMAQGQMPHEALLDGLAIFLGGTLLLTPGILTDILGFSLLIPFTRPLLLAGVATWMKKKMQAGQASVTFYQSGFGPGGGMNQGAGRRPEEKIYDQTWDDPSD